MLTTYGSCLFVCLWGLPTIFKLYSRWWYYC